MVEVTGELIKSAVCRRILEVWPQAEGRLFKEPQAQANAGVAAKEAYFVTQRRAAQTGQISGYAMRDYGIVIRFEPAPGSKKAIERCTEVANALMFAIRYIDVEGIKVKGQSIDYTVVDGILQLYVTYWLRINFIQPGPQMGNIKISSQGVI